MAKPRSSTPNEKPKTEPFVHGDIRAEYLRYLAEVDQDRPAKPFAIGTQDVLKAHFLLADHFRTKKEGIGGVGPRSLHLLESAVARQWAGYRNLAKWSDLTDVTATLFFGLIRNHPFHDANKRTALLCALYQLGCNNRVPSVSEKEFEEMTLRVAERTLEKYPRYETSADSDDPEVRFISHFFKRKTREGDSRHYVITYRLLDQILRRFGARLDNQTANTIDVLFDRTRSVFFVKRQVTHRAVQIRFHGWGSEVNREDIKRLRTALKLTGAYGIDSQVFFQGVEPLEALIAQYRGPLERLAFK
jgi:death-on-curing family protein